jgi:hypothetical protein
MPVDETGGGVGDGRREAEAAELLGAPRVDQKLLARLIPGVRSVLGDLGGAHRVLPVALFAMGVTIAARAIGGIEASSEPRLLLA